MQNIHTLLQPEVWSRILSHLPPDEISAASKLVSTTKNDSDSQHQQPHTIHQDASRIAVESMVQRAVHYCQATKNTPNDEHKPPTFPSSNGIDIDSFLGTAIMTSSYSKELLIHTLGKFSKQDWWDVYNELYIVYHFLAPLAGLGKDPNETMAHAVYSIYMLKSECPAY